MAIHGILINGCIKCLYGAKNHCSLLQRVIRVRTFPSLLGKLCPCSLVGMPRFRAPCCIITSTPASDWMRKFWIVRFSDSEPVPRSTFFVRFLFSCRRCPQYWGVVPFPHFFGESAILPCLFVGLASLGVVRLAWCIVGFRLVLIHVSWLLIARFHLVFYNHSIKVLLSVSDVA